MHVASGKYIQGGKMKILNASEIKIRTGLARSTWYKLIKVGDFPTPIKLSAKRIGFLEEDIDRWIELRVAGKSWAVADGGK